MDSLSPKPYRHGNIPNAMRSAALEMLDEDEADSVGLREAARRIGVSATAAYRHFPSKEGLLASVAAEGFIELFVAMHAAKKGPDPLIGPALAYVEFALRRRGLFRLMFGPILVVREKYPELNAAAAATFEFLQHATVAGEELPNDQSDGAIAAWGMIHGLSSLFMDGLIPETSARAMVERTLVLAGTHQH
jgi:AcrR family transcriptional regulator